MNTYGVPCSYSMLEIPSTPSINNAATFSGDIRFTINQPSQNCYIVGKSSYISIQLQISQVRETGLPAVTLEPIINLSTANPVTRATGSQISVPYLCPAPCSALFQNLSCYVKGEQISNHQNAQSVIPLYRMLYEGADEQNTVNSTNAILPMSQEDTETAIGVPYSDAVKVLVKLGILAAGAVPTMAQLGMFSKRMLYAFKNQYNFDKYKTNRLNLQVPFSLFFSDDLIHLGSGTDNKIDLVMNVDPNWFNSLIMIAGTNIDFNGVPYTVKPYGDPNYLANQTININVTDMKLYLCRGHIASEYVPRDKPQYIRLKQFSPYWCQLNANGSQNTIVAPLKTGRRITHVAIAFLTNPRVNWKSSPTDFSSGFSVVAPVPPALIGVPAAGQSFETKNTTDGMSLIQNVSMTYCGSTLPQAVYSLQADTVSSNTNDLGKAFMDYTVFTDSLRSQVGSLMNFSEWVTQQIYVYKTVQSTNMTSGNVEVIINLSANLGVPTNVLVLGLYDEYLSLHYDEHNRIDQAPALLSAPVSPPISA